MKSDDQEPPVTASPSDPDAEPRRSYARRIDCGRQEASPLGAPPREAENGRGTGRLRNPPEDH